jgi:hypothetical protein
VIPLENIFPMYLQETGILTFRNGLYDMGYLGLHGGIFVDPVPEATFFNSPQLTK